MTGYLFHGSQVPALDNNGNPLAGALMTIYLAKTSTLTPSYTSEALSVQNSNPVVADASGKWPAVYLDPDIPVRIKVTNATNSYTLYDRDYIAPGIPDDVALYSVLAGNGGAALIGTSTGQTVEQRLGAAITGTIGLFNVAGTASTGGAKYVWTSGYSAVGEGAAGYLQDNAVNSSFVSTYPRAAFISADGYGYRLDEEQYLTIEMFGGKGYATRAAALAGTDSLPAVQAYEAYQQFEPNTGVNAQYYPFVPDLHLGGNFYYFSATWEPRAIVRVKGLGVGHNVSGVPAGTVWAVPDNTTAIILPNLNTVGSGTGTQPTAQGSLIEGISFQGGGSDTTKHGIWLRTVATIRGCGFYTIPGHGIFLNATATSGGSTEGNTNTWWIEHCYVNQCGGDGLHVEGSDSNAGICYNFETTVCGGCGIYDASGLGNYYIGFHIAGYGNRGVTQGGRHYILVSNTAGIGASTTPGTNNLVWYDIGAGGVTSNFPAWSGSGTYTLALPVASFGSSSRSVFIGGYVEGAFPCHINGAALMYGGQVTYTRYTPILNRVTTQSLAIYSPTGVGAYTTYVPDHSTLGSYFEASVGTQDGIILNHRQQSDGDISWQFRYSGKDMIYQFGGSGLVPYGITGANTTKTFGRTSTVPKTFYADGMGLGDPANSNNTRYIQFGSAAPASGAHARGEIVFNVAPSAAGTFAWVCTAAGTPGTWTTLTLN